MKVSIPTPLRSYTAQAGNVEAEGGTISELLLDLDRRYPGIRFRMIDEQDAIRDHVRIFVNRERVVGLDARLVPSDEVQILQALSGG
jgi:molybdopterin synthase sulfur carrier subunit